MGSWKEEVTIVHISQEQVEADLQCYICLDDLVAGEEVMRLRCSHHYHEVCISPWLDKNNICPTCRQKILCREDPDPEEYDFEFDSGFLTDIIREINNIVYGVDSDEEFLYSDTPDIIDLSNSDGETILLEEQSARNERNSTSQDTSDIEVLHPQEPEHNKLPVVYEISSGEEETQSPQNVGRSAKRRRSVVEVEDSSDNEDLSFGDTVWLLQDVNRNQQNSTHSQPMKELISYSVNRNHPVGSRKKLRKRQRRSLESGESQYSQDSSDEEFEFHSPYATEASNRIIEENKQLVKGKENSEEPKKVSNNKSVNGSLGDESDDGVFVFDMDEVESLVSKLLEIMNEGEDESNSNEDEEAIQSCPKEWSKRRALNQENRGYFKRNSTVDDECDKIFSDEDAKSLAKPKETVSKDYTNCNVPSERLTVERSQSPCQIRVSKGKSVKRKISCSNSESSEDSNKLAVKRKASSSESECSNDDDSDGFESIEQIISELWSIVGQDGEESETDQNSIGSNNNNCNAKLKQQCLQSKESPKGHKRNQQSTFQGQNI